MKDVYFQHHYFKLDNFVFPTVRGVSWANVKPDMRVRIIDKELSLTYYAVVLENTIKVIKDLSLAFIRLDGTYAGLNGIHMPKDHDAFIVLLNSFRRFNKIETTDARVSVLWFVKEAQ